MNPSVNVVKLDYQLDYLLERKVGTQRKIQKSTKIFH